MNDTLIPDEVFDAAMDRMAREAALLMKPSKVLRAAADLLEQGWCQGSLGKRACTMMTGYEHVSTLEFKAGATIDQVCLMGAMMKALVDLYGIDWPGPAGILLDRTPMERAMVTTYLNTERAVEREIKTRAGVPQADAVLVAVWNDSKARTKAEVLDVVRITAAREEEAGR